MENIKRKIIILSSCIIIFLIIATYGNITFQYIRRNNFVKENAKVYEMNRNPIFKVKRIVLCSDANAIDLSEEQDMQDLNIYQYTDIAIYLENGNELSSTNTIKEMYIDNISIDGNDDLGQKSLTYKNTNQFGLKQEIKETKETNNIYFNIVHTNKENEEVNYNEATFFTDCSNPITLEYLNYNVKEGFRMEENKSVLFNGSILKEAGIGIKDIECNVKFKIHIINNENQKYSCPVNIQIPLKDIYNGTTMKSKSTDDNKYIFFREA